MPNAKPFAESETFIIGQCIAHPEIIPWVAKKFGNDPTWNITTYAWVHLAHAELFSMLCQRYSEGDIDFLTALANVAGFVDLPPICEMQNPRRSAIEVAGSLMNLQKARKNLSERI